MKAKQTRSVKTLKGQLFGAVAMIVVASVALGTSTYAWFINNQTVEVETMQLTVSTSTSLLVAVEKTDKSFTGMKSLVANDDIVGEGADQGGWTNFLSNKMTPASVTSANLATAEPSFFATNNHVSNGLLDQFALLPHDTTDDSVGQGPVKKLGLKFVSSGDVDVYFGQEGLTDIANLISAVAGAPEVGGVNAEAQAAAIRSALRVAIVPQATATYDGAVVPVVFQFDDGAAAAGHSNNTKYAGDAPTTTPAEPNGIYAAISAVDSSVDTNIGLVTADAPLNALVPKHAIAATNANNALAAVTGTGGAAEVTAPVSPIKLFQLKADEEREVDVYIWLEGTDKDCLNYLSAYNFGLALPFAAAPTPVSVP